MKYKIQVARGSFLEVYRFLLSVDYRLVYLNATPNSWP